MSLVVRPAGFEDALLLWKLRNDPSVRESAFDQTLIPWTTHQAWLRTKITSPDCRIWILELDGDPIGQVRFDRDGSIADTDIAIQSSRRGRGLGHALLALSTERACLELGVDSLVATIKAKNTPSARAFASAGFKPVDPDKCQSQPTLRFQYDCRAVAI